MRITFINRIERLISFTLKKTAVILTVLLPVSYFFPEERASIVSEIFLSFDFPERISFVKQFSVKCDPDLPLLFEIMYGDTSVNPVERDYLARIIIDTVTQASDVSEKNDFTRSVIGHCIMEINDICDPVLKGILFASSLHFAVQVPIHAVIDELIYINEKVKGRSGFMSPEEYFETESLSAVVRYTDNPNLNKLYFELGRNTVNYAL